jgi:hypothetical protein
MKTLIFFVLAILNMPATAKIWIVDSNPGSTAKDFVTLNAAYTGAAAGDTLYLIGSPNNYLTAKLLLSKRLTIIGPGYFLNENPDTQSVPVSALLSFISGCTESLEYASGSEGSILMGVTVSGLVVINTNNIAIRRCFINHVIGGCFNENIIVNGSNCLIQQNYISGSFSRGVKVNPGMANVTISNNYIAFHCANCDASIPALLATGATTVISNNVLFGALIASNAVVENNIFPFSSNFNANTSTVRNNIHPNNGLPAGNGNQNNVPSASVFEQTGSTDGYWKLKAGSPGLGTGFGGADCGMFGGPEPYVLSGIPPIPTIYSLIAPSVGEKNTGLPIQIKIKSNN